MQKGNPNNELQQPVGYDEQPKYSARADEPKFSTSTEIAAI